MSARHPHCTGTTRRSFLTDCGLGFTGLALGAMLQQEGLLQANPAEVWSPPTGQPHFAPKAKNVIWLFMLGGVSQMESFDPKPALTKYAGKTIEESPYFKEILESPHYRKNVRDFAGTPRALMSKIYPLQVDYRKRGESGIEVSDWWPHVGDCIDDLAVVRSVWCTDNDHAAQYEFHTGYHAFDGSHPSFGSWVHYGLGSLNQNLPSFVALGNPPDQCCGGRGAQSGSYLGPAHNAVEINVDPANPLAFSSPGPGVYVEEQQDELELLSGLNAGAAVRYPHDAALRARIQAYELAAKMQLSVPEVLKLGSETEHIRKLYGLDQPVTQSFGQMCLTARRLVERGVRFVQIYHGGSNAWDAHSDLKKNHGTLCPQVDQPIAALIKDLKQRGLFEETVVVWATEFGRTPGTEGTTGRDHHPYGFTIWMAGGGIKGGLVHGATDELGFHAVENRHYVTDVHATVSQQLGLDPRRLEIPGRKRLEIKLGKPIHEIIA